jgi:F0F1-type ATP synthase gamma subunit
MKPEQQQIAIAEACHVRIETDKHYNEVWYWSSGERTGPADSDLNAMHEAEEIMNDLQCMFFRRHLCEMLTEHPASRYVWHATAAQRAEAFLKTLNLWKP